MAENFHPVAQDLEPRATVETLTAALFLDSGRDLIAAAPAAGNGKASHCPVIRRLCRRAGDQKDCALGRLAAVEPDWRGQRNDGFADGGTVSIAQCPAKTGFGVETNAFAER